MRKHQASGLLVLWILLPLVAGSQEPPRITMQPRPAKVTSGETLTLEVQAEGDPPLTYHWYRENNAVPGANEPVLSIDGISLNSAGRYWVAVSNPFGVAGSDEVLVSVARPAVWDSGAGANGHRYELVTVGPQPFGIPVPRTREMSWEQTVEDAMAAGGYLASIHSSAEEAFINALAPPATFIPHYGGIQSVQPSQEPAEGWQWMSGEAFTYTRWAASEPNDGSTINRRGHENVLATFESGEWNDIHGGGWAYVMEYPQELVIYRQPDHGVISGYRKVAARGGAASVRPLEYTWFINDEEVPGVTHNALPVEAIAGASTVSCHFVVSDGEQSLMSLRRDLQVGPLIVQSPGNQIVHAGTPAAFSISARGPEPLSYQWFHKGVAIGEATDALFQIPSVAPEDVGEYHVEITNPHGSARSAHAELVVLSPASRLIRAHDFETSEATGWSRQRITVPPAGGRKFLGEFGAEPVSLSLTNLPPHDHIEISFDLILRGYWKGNGGPDGWRLTVDGAQVFSTTFGSVDPQSFPEQFPRGNFAAGTGARELNALGYRLVYIGSLMHEDARYRLEFMPDHSADDVVIAFSSDVTAPTEAAWALDNVVVSTRASNASRLRLTRQAGGTDVDLIIDTLPGVVVEVQRSINLTTWSDWRTVTNETGTLTLTVPIDELEETTFFRTIGQ